MQKWLAHRLESASTAVAKRDSAGRRLLTAIALTPVLGMAALTGSATAATYGPYNIRAENSNSCMDVRGGLGSTADGAVVQQYRCLGSAQTNQQWSFQDTGDGLTYYVIARNSGKCLDVRGGTAATANGTALQQYQCLGYAQSNQRWYLTRGPVGSTFNLRAANSNRCADVPGGPGAIADGLALQIWDCLGSAPTNQEWSLTTP